MMVPVAGQYEQACNALDGEQSGAGKKADFFDFDLLTTVPTPDKDQTAAYQAWAESWPSVFRKLVNKQESNTQKQSPALVFANT
jgi:hypothetical protein